MKKRHTKPTFSEHIFYIQPITLSALDVVAILSAFMNLKTQTAVIQGYALFIYPGMKTNGTYRHERSFSGFFAPFHGR